MQCGICDTTISDGAKCSACKKEIGYSCCANITENGFRKLGTDRRAAWRCLNCKRDASPVPLKQSTSDTAKLTAPTTAKPAAPSSAKLAPTEVKSSTSKQSKIDTNSAPLPAKSVQAGNTDFDTIMMELKEMKKHLACLPGLVREVEILKTELSEVKDSCNFTCAKLDECTVRIAAIEQKMPELDAVQEKVLALTKEIHLLKENFARNDQLMRLNNVEIKGIPHKKNENLFAILGKICSTINYTFDKNCVNYISRVPIHNSKEKLIIVNFTNRYVKENFIASARLKKTITAADFGFEGNTHNVYLNDHLTPENKKLLTLTKSTLKPKGYIHVWVRYCKIHVRKDDNSEVHIINSERDLNKLF